MTDVNRRVAITGMGAITPSGLDVASLWDSVVAGRSAITTLDGPEFADLPVRIGGQIIGFDATGIIAPTLARRLSPVQQWAIVAADQAMRQAGVIDGAFPGSAPDQAPGLPWPRERFAVIAATGSGPIDAMQQATRTLDASGPRAVPITLSVYGAPDAAAAILAQRYRAFGPSQGVSATCASGAVGLGMGMRWIRHGYADAVLVVGMEDCLNGVNLASNARLRALARDYEEDPAAACRPFDRSRSGFVMASGAAAILLEAADARTVLSLAELAGFGASSDAYHATAPDPGGRGAAQAILECLADADVAAVDVDHINAHGTGTQLGDSAEIAALRTAFGDCGPTIPLTATKSCTGHLLGASGVVEAIIAVHTLRNGVVPPTINLTDPEFPDWDVVTGSARNSAVRSVLSTSFGFGGHNGALLLQEWNEKS
ncbi:MAG: beta-ketoacyl-[acyl-carrier-protein] synthase family protein [Nakamurella sp.]